MLLRLLALLHARKLIAAALLRQSAKRLAARSKQSAQLKQLSNASVLHHFRMYLCRAWHDGNICTRIANNTFCAVGILVFLSLLASLAGVVAAVLFGQIYPRVSRQGWSYPAQAHINYSPDGYDGGYFYYLLYKNATHPNHRLGSWSYRLYCSRFLYSQSQTLTDTRYPIWSSRFISFRRIRIASS